MNIPFIYIYLYFFINFIKYLCILQYTIQYEIQYWKIKNQFTIRFTFWQLWVWLWKMNFCGFSFHFMCCYLGEGILEGIESERFDQINELLYDSKLFFILGFWGIGLVSGAIFGYASESPCDCDVAQTHIGMSNEFNDWSMIIWESIFWVEVFSI